MSTNLRNLNFKQMLKDVELMLFDIDGVLSANNVQIGENGELIRTTNVKDGYVLKYAIKKGLKIAIISGGLNESVKLRFELLGIEDVIIGCKNKLVEFERLLHKYNVRPEKVLYMGDDIPDYQVMKNVGLACCPSDAADEIKEISIYISSSKGGEACVRDIIGQVLRAKGLWMDNDAFET
jgi:3-deoxy-D-manno-octulosonate 8-phosphate phosphatase (KDO 8-P phosphatase)